MDIKPDSNTFDLCLKLFVFVADMGVWSFVVMTKSCVLGYWSS